MEQKKLYLKVIMAAVSILLVVGGFYYFKYYKNQKIERINNDNYGALFMAPADSEIKFSTSTESLIVPPKNEDIIFNTSVESLLPAPERPYKN